MKHSFYPKLAWTGIRKNKRLYTPYILTCMGMVMMFYIMSFLTSSALLTSMPGGDIMQGMLGLGVRVIGVFALIFLFYTNSFLTRRRKKEFGLYNILGMGKRNLARVLMWESLIIGRNLPGRRPRCRHCVFQIRRAGNGEYSAGGGILCANAGAKGNRTDPPLVRCHFLSHPAEYTAADSSVQPH